MSLTRSPTCTVKVADSERINTLSLISQSFRSHLETIANLSVSSIRTLQARLEPKDLVFQKRELV